MRRRPLCTLCCQSSKPAPSKHRPSQQELRAANRQNKQLTFEEFLQLIAGNYAGDSTYKDLFKVFQLFHPDGTGGISAASLSAIVKEIGEDFSQEDINEMIRIADANGDGLVTMDEFYRIMTKPHFA